MSDFVAITSIKDALAECPICTEYFNDTSRIPRRMPCCLQAICETCLETYSQGRRTIACPLCRKQHTLPGGVKALPKEMVILRFLDVLKTQSNAVPSCTDCPKNNTAMVRCDTCSIYLCQPCFAAHSKNKISKGHKTTTFEEITRLRSMRSSSVDQMKSGHSSHAKRKLENIERRIDRLSAINKNIEQSRRTATTEINMYFDDLIKELQERRGILLSQVEAKAEKEQKPVLRAIESNKALHQNIEKGAAGSVITILDQSPEDVDYDRRGISFVGNNKDSLTSIISSSGVLRTITFTPGERPSSLDARSPCYTVSLENVSTPQDSPYDLMIQLQNGTFYCPYLEYDTSTKSEDLNVSGTVIRNSPPEGVPPQNTGCRMESWRKIFFSQPFVVRSDHLCLYMMNIHFELKQKIPFDAAIFAMSSTVNPMDMNCTPVHGFVCDVRACSHHEEHKDHLCFCVLNNNCVLFCAPVVKNTVNMACEFCIAIVLDPRKRSIHVIKVDDARRITTVCDVPFDRPLWTMVYIGRPEWVEMQAEILSGEKMKVSQNMLDTLKRL